MTRRTLYLGLATLLAVVVWVASQRGVAPGETVEAPAPIAAPPEEAEAEVVAVPDGGARVVEAPAAIEEEGQETAAAAPELATLAVLVRSAQTAAPIGGARLYAWTQEGRGGGRDQPRTGLDGRAELELDAGPAYSLRVTSESVSASNAVLEVGPLDPGERRELVVELETELDRALRGRVLERGTRAPIEGARVTLGSFPDRAAEPRATSDAEGRFRAAFGAWERTALCVDADGYGFALLPLVEGHDAAAPEVEVLLEPAASLAIALVDSAGGAVRGALVTLVAKTWELAQVESLASGLFGDTRWKARTDDAGRARFEELPARVALTPSASLERELLTGAPEPLRLEPGEERALEWRVGSGAAVAVEVLEQDGRPAARVSLSLERATRPRPYFLNSYAAAERRSAKTDERGIARFEDVPAGDWAVGPTPRARHESAEDDPAPLARNVAVPELGEVRVELPLQRGVAIRGRVVAPEGGELRHAYVSAYEEAQQLFAIGRVDVETGEFVAAPLVAGRYRLVASGPPHASSPPVVVDAGATDVELRLRAGAAIEGSIVDAASGEPSSAGFVVSSSEPLGDVRMGDAREGGRFRVEGLAPGTYHVAAAGADGSCGLSRPIQLEEGREATGVEVALRPGARVRLRYTGPASSASVELRHTGTLVDLDGVKRGDELLLACPPGSAQLRLRPADGSPEALREIELAAGETLELAFADGWE